MGRHFYVSQAIQSVKENLIHEATSIWRWGKSIILHHRWKSLFNRHMYYTTYPRGLAN